MGIIENLVNKMGYFKAKDQYPAWLLATAGAERFSIPNPAMWKSQADLYRRLSWINIAIGAVARSCAGVALSVKKMVKEDEEDITNHPFELLLQRPNPKESRFQLLEATFSYQALTGNAYWWLNQPNENAEPAEIWNIPSYKLEPIPDERLYLKGYRYDPGDGGFIMLEPWEIVHFRNFNPLNEFIGLSPIEALATIAVGDLKMQDWNTRLFGENNARLPGIMAFADPIPDTEWDKLKKDTTDSANMRRHMMLRNVGPGGVQWLQAAMSQKDMEFLKGREMNKEEVFATYAPGLASMLAVNATEANARTGKATFTEFALWPILAAAAEKITNDLLPVYGDNLKAEFDDIRVTDRVIELSEEQEYAKTHTIDEIRMKHYGDDPIGDDRGQLLPAQVTAEPGGLMEEEEEEEPQEPSEAPGELTGELFGADVQVGAEPEMEEELKAWKRYAIKRIGKESRPFKSDIIPPALQGAIQGCLEEAKTAEDVVEIFADVWQGYP